MGIYKKKKRTDKRWRHGGRKKKHLDELAYKKATVLLLIYPTWSFYSLRLTSPFQ